MDRETRFEAVHGTTTLGAGGSSNHTGMEGWEGRRRLVGYQVRAGDAPEYQILIF